MSAQMRNAKLRKRPWFVMELRPNNKIEFVRLAQVCMVPTNTGFLENERRIKKEKKKNQR